MLGLALLQLGGVVAGEQMERVAMNDQAPLLLLLDITGLLLQELQDLALSAEPLHLTGLRAPVEAAIPVDSMSQRGVGVPALEEQRLGVHH